MKRERLTNRELDELGKRLVAAARPGEGEIERLVSNPGLYGGVLAKIAELDGVGETEKRRFFWKPAAAMAIGVVVVSVSVLAFLKFGTSSPEVVRKPRVLPYVVNEKPSAPDAVFPRTKPVDLDEERPRAIHAVVTRTVEAPPAKRPRRQKAENVPVPEAVFHPIGLDERAEDAALDGRVVRVELPRAALFAMGVDLPLENGTRAVKADLLVGADGIPKGIRLVD